MECEEMAGDGHRRDGRLSFRHRRGRSGPVEKGSGSRVVAPSTIGA